MKPEILNNDHMMFLDRALETQRTALLTAMADAVAECRTAADQAAELTETGEIVEGVTVYETPGIFTVDV